MGSVSLSPFSLSVRLASYWVQADQEDIEMIWVFSMVGVNPVQV